MKKVIIADEIKSLLEKEKSFLNRSCIRIFTAASNTEILDIHKKEKAELIITRLDVTEMCGEEFCSTIRNDKELCKVSIIIVCSNNKSHTERTSRCRANAFITQPVNPSVLFEKAHQLINIPLRGAYRSPIGIRVDGKYENKPFLCYSENLSTSGMMFETDKILSQGDLILCSFILPDSTHIVANAEIVRIGSKITEFDANQYGIKFSNLNAECISAIEAFIKKNHR